jgi:hypothetical protein
VVALAFASSLKTYLTHLSGTSATQCSQQSISSMMAWCAHDPLNHRNHAGALEQVHLPRIFLKDLCEGEALYRPLAVVVCRRLDGDMCGVAFALFDAEEARISSIRRAQAQEDVEERTRGSLWKIHCGCVYVCLGPERR